MAKVRLTQDEWYLIRPANYGGVECEVPDELIKRYRRTEKAFMQAEAEVRAIFNATLDEQDDAAS